MPKSFMLPTLRTRIDAGDFEMDQLQVDSANLIDLAIDKSNPNILLLKHPTWPDFFQCPGENCRHWRHVDTLIDCRHIDPKDGTEGQPFMCDGCWTFMVHRAGKDRSLFEKVAIELQQEIGKRSTFKQRQTILRDRVRRKVDRSKAIDDLLDPIADVMQKTSLADMVPALKQKKLDGSDLSCSEVCDFMLNRKMNDGVLITMRHTRNMPISLWLGLHNAPKPEVDRVRGLPRDFLP